MSVTVVPHLNFAKLAASLEAEWPEEMEFPLARPVVVPSVAFADQLRTWVARRTGVCMGWEFLTSRTLVARALEENDEERWERRNLTWRILPEMERLTEPGGVFAGAAPWPRDQLALAGLLADQFDQYGTSRPEMIRAWIEGKKVVFRRQAGPMAEAESWQRDLFLRLGEVQSHPAIRLLKKKNDAAFLEQLRRQYPRLLVLGTGALDPLLIEVLQVLDGAGVEVSVQVLLPSLAYLGELGRGGWKPGLEEAPDEMELPESHPLLASMGRQSVGSFVLLGRLDENYAGWPEEELSGEEEKGDSLLGRLQRDLRSLRSPQAAQVGDKDLSLRVHSCFGPRREMEGLRDELLRAFEEWPDLHPEEIQIVAPDPTIYAPLVAAVLEPAGLPVRLMEWPAAEGEALTEGLLALLEMTRDGRWTASGLLDLLRLRAVRRALALEDDPRAEETLAGWIETSGLRQGLGREEEGGAVGTWRAAADRLMAGRWLGPDVQQTYPDGSFVLPLHLPFGGEEELLRRFLAWLENLGGLLHGWQQPAPARIWAARLTGAIRSVLAAPGSAQAEDCPALSPHLAFLRAQNCAVNLDAGAILDWLGAETEEAGRRSLMTGRITLARFKQLQNMPCRILAMVGMQQGAFPSLQRVPAWDLRAGMPQVWDRHPAVDDRQLFLDALLAPKDRLIITAANRHVRTGVTEPLSSCVDELLRVLTAMGAEEKNLVVRHRLQPFVADYFPAVGEAMLPPSYDGQAARATARLLEPGAINDPPFYEPGGETMEAGGTELGLGELIRFWKNPARGFLRAQGIGQEEEIEDLSALDQSPLTLDPLEAWQARQQYCEVALRQDGGTRYWPARLQAERLLPPSCLGHQTWEGIGEVCRGMVESMLLLGLEEREMEVRGLGRKGPDSEGMSLRGRVWVDRAGGQLMVWSPGKFEKPAPFMEAWCGALLAAAADHPLPTRIFGPEEDRDGRLLPAVDATTARDQLEILLEGYLLGRQCPLPFAPQVSETMAKCLAEGRPDAEVWNEAAKAWWKEDRGRGVGEGHSEEVRLVWRGSDPMAGGDGVWLDWARRVAGPLLQWRKS